MRCEGPLVRSQGLRPLPQAAPSLFQQSRHEVEEGPLGLLEAPGMNPLIELDDRLQAVLLEDEELFHIEYPRGGHLLWLRLKARLRKVFE